MERVNPTGLSAICVSRSERVNEAMALLDCESKSWATDEGHREEMSLLLCGTLLASLSPA